MRKLNKLKRRAFLDSRKASKSEKDEMQINNLRVFLNSWTPNLITKKKKIPFEIKVNTHFQNFLQNKLLINNYAV